jgi:hypothetical protein
MWQPLLPGEANQYPGGIMCRFLLSLLPIRNSQDRADNEDGNREILHLSISRKKPHYRTSLEVENARDC